MPYSLYSAYAHFTAATLRLSPGLKLVGKEGIEPSPGCPNGSTDRPLTHLDTCPF